MGLKAQVLHVDASPAGMQNYFEAQGWTDGLPVVPPTPELVTTMVEASGLPPEADVALMAPSLVMATVEKVAINAVMAGCRPEYMPVVLAALRAEHERRREAAEPVMSSKDRAPLVIEARRALERAESIGNRLLWASDGKSDKQPLELADVLLGATELTPEAGR